MEKKINLPPGRIKAIREKRGLSKREMAKAIGLAPNAFIRYEAGKRIPNQAVMLLISLCDNDHVWKVIRKRYE